MANRRLSRRNVPVEIIQGHKVVEIRPHGVNKGSVVGRVLGDGSPDTLVVALGDDRTDEDLFAALPDDAVSIHVGAAESGARYRIADVTGAREFLRALACAGG